MSVFFPEAYIFCGLQPNRVGNYTQAPENQGEFELR